MDTFTLNVGTEPAKVHSRKSRQTLQGHLMGTEPIKETSD